MTQRFKTTAALCALLTFSLNALIADGFMPAALADGYPVQLCPDGLDFMPVAETMHSHHHGPTNTASGNEHSAHEEHDVFSASECPFGGGLVAGLTALVINAKLAKALIATQETIFRPRARLLFSSYQARAPPA